MELQHNLSFPLFIKKSCIFEQHICSEWGISATHERLLQSPCHVAYPLKNISLDCCFFPCPSPWLTSDHTMATRGWWMQLDWGQVSGAGDRVPFFHLWPNSDLESHWLLCSVFCQYKQREKRNLYYLSQGTESEGKQTAERMWMLLGRNVARPCCHQIGFCSKGRPLAELE